MRQLSVVLVMALVWLSPQPAWAQAAVVLTPDEGTVPQGGKGLAHVDAIDNGRGSTLSAIRGVPAGVVVSFNPKSNPVGAQDWQSTMTVNVGTSVTPGDYTIVVGLRQHDNNKTVIARAPWSLHVPSPPEPTPSPTPSPTQTAPPTPPAGESSPTPEPSPTPTPTTPTPAPTASPSVMAGSFIDNPNPYTKGTGSTSDGPTNRRYSMALSVDDSSVFDPTAGKLVSSALLALLLTLLIVFPAELFNKTWQENSYRIRTKFGGGEPGVFRKLSRRLSRTWWGFILLTLLTAGLYGLLSPDFGLNSQSLGLFLAIAAALVIVIAANELTATLYARRHIDRVYLRVFPGALFVAVVCVAISRLAEFQPGYLYGLVAGAAFRGGVGKDIAGKSAAIASLGLLAVSIGAWVAWLPVRSMAASSDASQAILVLEAFLVATFVAGLESLMFGLVPLTFLDGQKLASWNRAIWAVLFFLSAFAFVHILLHPDASYLNFSPDIPMIVVLSLFVGFGIFSVAFWAYFRFRQPPQLEAG